MSLETSITDLTAASNALTNAVNGKVAAIDAEVQAVKDAYNVAVVTTNSALNLLTDSGRFDGGSGGGRSIASGLFANNAFFNSINGSVFSDGGKFSNDNSTNGGGGPALPVEIVNLLNYLNRFNSAAQFGVEFYINKIVAGAGTSNPYLANNGITHYRLFTNNELNIFDNDRKTTITFMMKVVSGSTVFSVDSIAKNAGDVIVSADGWTRVTISTSSALGYNNGYPFISATPGSEVLVALPFLHLGEAQINNTSPITTL